MVSSQNKVCPARVDSFHKHLTMFAVRMMHVIDVFTRLLKLEKLFSALFPVHQVTTY